MTYPPTNPGYPAPQQPGGYGVGGVAGVAGVAGAAPGGVPGPAPYPAPAARPNRMPSVLAVAVLVLGLAAFFASFGPLLVINTDIGPFGGAEFTASGLSYWTVAAVLAALLAAVGLLPRSANYTPIVAVAAVLAVLLVIAQIINRPSGFSVGWALWLVLLFTAGQAVAAVTALLFQSGVLSAAPARARYPYQGGQYGPPPSSYYPAAAGGQRPGYPTAYAGYPPYGSADPAGGPDTPPTGFPSYPPAPSGETAKPAEPAPGTAPGSSPGTAPGSSPGSTQS